MASLRVNVFQNGSKEGGHVIKYPHSLFELAVLASAKLGLEVAVFYNEHGCLVDDDHLVRDGDVLYAAREGEPFSAREVVSRLSADADTSRWCGGVPEAAATLSAPVGGTEWVTLNVGGRLFTTSRTTLTRAEPDSMLAKMFGGEACHLRPADRDASGAYLIDRSPTYFEPVLNYLRTRQLVLDAGVCPAGVLEEARYFGVQSLVPRLEALAAAAPPAGGEPAPLGRQQVVRALLVTPSEAQLRFQGVNFAGADLSKLDLRNINFKYACLRDCNLRHCNLTGCCLERADLSGANLDSAQLSCVRMMCANLESANMRSCNFEDPGGIRANLEGAHMKGAILTGSNMSSINLRVATLKNADLQDCDLRLAILAGADLENCNLSGSDLHEANLRGANLTNTAFELMLTPIHMSQTVR